MPTWKRSYGRGRDFSLEEVSGGWGCHVCAMEASYHVRVLQWSRAKSPVSPDNTAFHSMDGGEAVQVSLWCTRD